MVILFCKFTQHTSVRLEVFSPGQLTGSARTASADLRVVARSEKALALRAFNQLVSSMFCQLPAHVTACSHVCTQGLHVRHIVLCLGASSKSGLTVVLTFIVGVIAGKPLFEQHI